jgi:hypothetical protein
MQGIDMPVQSLFHVDTDYEHQIEPVSEAMQKAFTLGWHRRIRRRMFLQMRDRERKRFTRLCHQLEGTRPSFNLKWKIKLADVQFIMDYWKDHSALEECGLSAILTEKARRVKSTTHGQSLGLMIWNLKQLVQDHIDRYPPIQTEQGAYRPPLFITIADVLPLTLNEQSNLSRKGCSKVASFCVKRIEESLVQYRAACKQ